MDDQQAETYDAIVVGGGPAGLSAATWLARYRRRVLVLDGGDYRNRFTTHVHGYLGSDPCTPQDLLTRGRDDLARYEGTAVERATVDAAGRDGDGSFWVADGARRWRAEHLVLATGVRDEFPDIEGFFDHYGASVFHCPSCDGYEARDKRVVVLGWAEHVAPFARGLLHWAASVTIVTDGMPFETTDREWDRLDDRGIDVIQDVAVRFLGTRGHMTGIALRGGSVVDCEMAFFNIGHHPRTEVPVMLGCDLTDEGYVVADLHGATSVEGVFAAGDCTPGPQLVQVAAAKGTAAGVACALSLQKKRRGARR